MFNHWSARQRGRQKSKSVLWFQRKGKKNIYRETQNVHLMTDNEHIFVLLYRRVVNDQIKFIKFHFLPYCCLRLTQKIKNTLKLSL